MHAIEATVDENLAETEARIRRALADEGFGVLTEIDVAATLRAKLGVERPALKILGACNPSFAHRALEADPAVSYVLPCNVVLEDVGGGRTHVAIADPRALLGAFTGARHDELEELGAEAAGRLEHALSALGA
ncbi:MAG: DUF302 domain-containing protein [Acidobacteriota bacterium]|nr:DUF302 domain-containing protein [Acidobacteriota bacterium]